MIAGLLIVGLIAALLGVWLFVEVIDFLHSGAKAFRRYLKVTDEEPYPVYAPENSTDSSAHELWNVRKQRPGGSV